MKVLPFLRQSERRRVLILEDHDLLRTSMVRALSELRNVTIVGAGTVREALKEIDTSQPDLIVSDLDLPDGSGLELMPHARGQYQPSVVFVSGHINRFEPQLDHYPGVVVLDKPLPARTLKHIVTEQLDAERNAAPPFAAGDYIQLACLGRHSVRIDVRGHSLSGTIFIKQGRLWSANEGRRTGLSALSRLTFTEGARVTCGGVPLIPGPANLPDFPWEQMLLNLAREHDENARKSPVARDDPDPDEMDFSDIFEEEEVPFITPSSAPALEVPAVRSSDETRFERLLDDAHDALLDKNYTAALHAFETAEALRPNDSVVKGNVARLRELVHL